VAFTRFHSEKLLISPEHKGQPEYVSTQDLRSINDFLGSQECARGALLAIEWKIDHVPVERRPWTACLWAFFRDKDGCRGNVLLLMLCKHEFSILASHFLAEDRYHICFNLLFPDRKKERKKERKEGRKKK
jgi:hypothetical protein